MTEQPRVTISLGNGSLITLRARVNSILLTRYSGEEVAIAGHEVNRVFINLDLSSLLTLMTEEAINEYGHTEEGTATDNGDDQRGNRQDSE